MNKRIKLIDDSKNQLSLHDVMRIELLATEVVFSLSAMLDLAALSGQFLFILLA